MNLDLSEVIALREALIECGPREENLAHDALDFTWMDKVAPGGSERVFVFSCGVTGYLEPADVRALICAMARRFLGGCYFFDCVTERVARISNRMVVKTGNKGAPVRYWVNHGSEEIRAYSEAIESVENIRTVPGEYDRLPLAPRLMFRLEMGRESWPSSR